MEDYGQDTYGERIAPIYDDLYADLFDVEGAVRFLAPLGGGGALEFGIGTGRIALPLAAAGVEVVGVDTSQKMVDRLRAKPGGADLEVVMGDFSEVEVERDFSLVYLPFNTIFGLPDQEAQVRCFANAARHLTDDGVFVIEAFVPDTGRFDRGQRISTTNLGPDLIDLEASRHDPIAQRVESQHAIFRSSGIELYPVVIRYAYPPELDLMARLTGLRLRERWANWTKDAFTSDSAFHISVYERDHIA